MRAAKGYQARLRKLVEMEYERFLVQRSSTRSQQSIMSFAIDATRANTRAFLRVLNEEEIITLLGGRTADSYRQELTQLLGSPPL